MACPLCRASFAGKNIYIPKVDLKLQAKIEKELGPVYAKAKAELIKEGNYFNGTRLVRFTYGNTWAEIKKPGVKSGHKLTNSWSMQLSINDGKENVGKYVQ